MAYLAVAVISPSQAACIFVRFWAIAAGVGVTVAGASGLRGLGNDKPLLTGLQPVKVLADTAYDSDATRAYCIEMGIEAVVPSHPGRTEALPTDEESSRNRNQVERFFGRLKQYRCLATRYEKTVVSFLAFWHISAAPY